MGATAIEYGLIAAPIAVGIIAAARGLESQISATCNTVATKMQSAGATRPLSCHGPHVRARPPRVAIGAANRTPPRFRQSTLTPVASAVPKIRNGALGCTR
jgi:pilus assembly protein Flp/PilA